jgi:DNA sulfur modification protein DndD
MIFERVELENFGPYYGKQVVELGGGEHPLIVIHGENMSGKTSFLNAVRWGLYGYAKDRGGAKMSIRKIINDDAYREGERRVGVRLHVRTDDQRDVVLRRQCQAREGVPEAVADSDFEEVLSIEIDGNVLRQSQFDDTVNAILPEGISRFFLFDGELLNEYEDLVREGGELAARRVKQSIELILGVPAATRGRDDVRTLREEADRRYRREAKKDAAAAEAADMLEFHVGEQEARLADQARLSQQIEQAEVELRGLETELKRYDELREDAGLLDGLRQTQRQLDDRRQQLLADRREHVSSLWRDALAPRLRHELERLERDRSAIEVALTELSHAEHRIGELQTAIDEKSCKTCGQAMPEEAMARIRVDLAETARRADTLRATADVGRMQELSGTIKHLRDIAPAGVDQAVAQIERELGALKLQHYKNDQKANLLVERLKDVQHEVILEYERKRNALLRHLASMQNEADLLARRISEGEANVTALRRKLREKDLPGLRKLKTEVEILESLASLFDEAVQQLIAELRVEVERQATDIFGALTTDQTYSGLRINDMYGLTILDKNEQEVAVRSAGAEQVVALSLIGALNRLAIKKGPVIMDTPFGRLDTKHRANILRFVPTLAEQVVLLVHGGELDRERDLAGVADRIDEEYIIEHPTSSQSLLTRLNGNPT